MKKWLTALWSETLFWFWWFLSAVSTLSTYFFPGGWSGKLRPVFAISFVFSFAWANFRVFQEQERRISALSTDVASRETRVSELKIKSFGGSYILRPVRNVPHADFDGGFVNLQLMIENTGRRNSIVDRYDIEITELKASFENLRPEEGRNAVHGRHCTLCLEPKRILSTTGMVKIDIESGTDRGELLFFLPGLTLERFTEAGLRMNGVERRFGTIRCHLTITDTMGSSAGAVFELNEG
jgi:hypothetical protein